MTQRERLFPIEFISRGTIIVDPENPPSSGIGRPGSILDIALASGIKIEHACGGVGACATCHIYVKDGYDSCEPPTETEEDQLEKASGVSAKSRLACQTCPLGKAKISVVIPPY